MFLGSAGSLASCYTGFNNKGGFFQVFNKRQVKQDIKKLQRVQIWQLVILFILFGFLSATFLRLNNIGMIDRRDAVTSADEQGDDTKTQNRLYDLQRYVSSHMNTDLGKGVFLSASYSRDRNELIARAATDINPNGNIYEKVQEICRPQFSRYSFAYIQCTLNELEKYQAGSNLVSTVSLRTEPYIHDFASPLWSPDFAGWSLVICGVILSIIIIRLTSVGILKLLLRHHYKSI